MTATLPARPSGGALAAPGTAAAARKSAHQVRFEYLQEVMSQMLTIHDVIDAARSAHNRPLLRIRLRQLLLAQPGWGNGRTEVVLNKMVRLMGPLGTSLETNKLTLSWLLDPRAAGKRITAFLDATKPQDLHTPWATYPFGPPPARFCGPETRSSR